MNDYTINDRRDEKKSEEVCRVCGSPQVHSKEYGKPTVNCIEYLRTIISSHEDEKTYLITAIKEAKIEGLLEKYDTWRERNK